MCNLWHTVKEISLPLLLHQKSIFSSPHFAFSPFSSCPSHSHSHLSPPSLTSRAGPPAANNRPNNPSSHPQTHPGRAPSQGERRQTEENYRGPVCRRAPWTGPPAPSWAVHGWNVGNSFWRHAPHHHLPGGPTTLCCICHLETEIRGGGGDQSGWNWRGGGDHRGEFPLCPLISQLSRPTSISSRFGRKPSHCHRPPSCQTHISPSSPPQNQPQSEAACVYNVNVNYIVINHHPLADFHCDSDPSLLGDDFENTPTCNP